MDTKSEAKTNTTKKFIKIDYLAFLAKLTLIKEITPQIKDSLLAKRIINGSYLILDYFIHKLPSKAVLELDLNLIKYMAYVAAQLYLTRNEITNEELIKFVGSSLSTYLDAPVYNVKISRLKEELEKIKNTAEIDFDIVIKILDQNQKEYFEKFPPKDKILFDKIFIVIFSHVRAKLSLYHFAYVNKQLSSLINQILIITQFVIDKKSIQWDSIKDYCKSHYEIELSDADKVTFTVIDEIVKEVTPQLKRMASLDENPFSWLPAELRVQITNYLAPKNDDLLKKEAYLDLANVAKSSRDGYRMVNYEGVYTWSDVLRRIINTQGYKVKGSLKHHLVGYENFKPMYNTSLIRDFRTDISREWIKDLCVVIKDPQKSAPLVKKRNNPVVNHFYLRGVMFNKVITDLKSNDDNVRFVGEILKLAFDLIQKGDLSGLFMLLELLGEILNTQSKRFRTKACGVINEKAENFAPNSDKSVDIIEAYIQSLLAKASGVVFKDAVPTDFNFNILAPWTLALAFDPVLGTKVFLATYKRMLKIKLTKEVCLSLSQCKNPHGVLNKLIKFNKGSLLEKDDWQAQVLKILDTLTDDETEFFFKFYANVLELSLEDNASLEVLSKTKEIFGLRSYLAEPDILQVCSNKAIFLKTLCRMETEQLGEINKFKANFLSKYPDAVQPEVQVIVYICYYNLQEIFLSSPHVPELLKIINLNALFATLKVNEAFAKKLTLLLSVEGLPLIRLFQENPDLLPMLDYKYLKIANLLRSENEFLLKYLRDYKPCNFSHLGFIVKHPLVFISKKLTVGALNNSITGKRLDILRDFPGRFEKWEKSQLQKFFSSSGKMSKSIFDNQMFTKIVLFMEKFPGELIYQDLESFVVENVFGLINPLNAEAFVFLYENLSASQIIELNKCIGFNRNALSSLLNISRKELPNLFEAFEKNFEQIKIFACSSICEMAGKFPSTGIMDLCKKLGIKQLEYLHSVASIMPNQSILQTMLSSPPEKIDSFIQESAGNMQILINKVISYKTFSGENISGLNSLMKIRGKNGFFTNPLKRENNDGDETLDGMHIEEQIEECLPRIKRLRQEGNQEELKNLLATIKNKIDDYLLGDIDNDNENSNNMQKNV